MANGVWTNNWRAVRNIMLMGRHVIGLSTFTTLNGSTVQNINNLNGGYMATGLSPLASFYQTDYFARNRIVLGTSSVVPTAADYNVGAAAANISYLSGANTSSESIEDATITTNFTLSVQYTGSGSITITEWGLVGSVMYGNTNLTSYYHTLLYHELLDTPVTLSTYQSANLNLTLTMTLTDPL